MLRAEPSGEAEVLARIAKGDEIALLFDYVYLADNGYDYMPVRYDTGDKTYYGWVAVEYLGMNERVDAITWVGRRPMELEYPSAEEIMAQEEKDSLTLTATVGNKPKKGDAFKKGETIVFAVTATNNTFEDIENITLGDAEITVPWRQSRTVEISREITAEEAANGALTGEFAATWTDADGIQHTALSEQVTVPTAEK